MFHVKQQKQLIKATSNFNSKQIKPNPKRTKIKRTKNGQSYKVNG